MEKHAAVAIYFIELLNLRLEDGLTRLSLSAGDGRERDCRLEVFAPWLSLQEIPTCERNNLGEMQRERKCTAEHSCWRFLSDFPKVLLQRGCY